MPAKLTTKQFISKAIKKHGDKYDYSKVDYIGSNDKVIIICKEHGEFPQRAGNHLDGHTCYKCKLMTTNKFIELSKEKHGNKYDYSKSIYTSYFEKLDVICRKHGPWLTQANNHIQGRGCPRCKKINSRGSIKIEKYLNDNNIEYVREKYFNDCRSKNPLPFDFYLPEYNICIEYDGEQHFKPMINWGGQDRLEQTQKRDGIKNDYCGNNNIGLIRIPYTKLKEIDIILYYRLL